jgi:hypothetical protein
MGGPNHNLLDWVRRHDEYEPAAASGGSGERHA